MHEGEHDGTMPMSLRALPRGSGGSRSRAIPVASSAVSSSSQPLPLPSPSPSPSSRSRLFTLLLGPYALALTIYTLWQQSAGPLLGVERGGLGVVAASSRMIVAFWSKGSSGGAEFWNPSLAHGPLTVLAISPARTSSTVAFNLARILLERLDPSTASGWELDLVGLKNLEKGGEWEATLLQDVLGPARAGNLSIIIKSHQPAQPYLQTDPPAFDFVLTSYRDPYDAICSEARKFHPYLFTDIEAAHKICAARVQVEQGVRALAAKAPRGSLHVDASLLWSREGLLAVAQELVAAWGVTPGTRGPLDLEGVVADVLRLEPPPPGVFPVHAQRTLLHPQHNTGASSAEGKASCKELMAALAKDSACQGLHTRYVRLFGGNGERKIYRGEELARLQRQQQGGEEEEEEA